MTRPGRVSCLPSWAAPTSAAPQKSPLVTPTLVAGRLRHGLPMMTLPVGWMVRACRTARCFLLRDGAGQAGGFSTPQGRLGHPIQQNDVFAFLEPVPSRLIIHSQSTLTHAPGMEQFAKLLYMCLAVQLAPMAASAAAPGAGGQNAGKCLYSLQHVHAVHFCAAPWPSCAAPCFALAPPPPCSGEAAVTQGGKEVNRLFKADFFGERALLSNEPRGATVVASQQTVCLVLDRDTFVDILGPLDKAMAVSQLGAPPAPGMLGQVTGRTVSDVLLVPAIHTHGAWVTADHRHRSTVIHMHQIWCVMALPLDGDCDGA